MNVNYSDMVAALVKPGKDVVASLTPEMADAWHMATGVAGEAGELLDAVKKAAIYCKPIDLENVIEELGDLEFYMEGLRQRFGLTREECLEANISKLSIRYKSGVYSNCQAQDRADKK
jgi:NTP pyrophosphatase (non-canonical NTP hydrolase)